MWHHPRPIPELSNVKGEAKSLYPKQLVIQTQPSRGPCDRECSRRRRLSQGPHEPHCYTWPQNEWSVWSHRVWPEAWWRGQHLGTTLAPVHGHAWSDAPRPAMELLTTQNKRCVLGHASVHCARPYPFWQPGWPVTRHVHSLPRRTFPLSVAATRPFLPVLLVHHDQCFSVGLQAPQ